MFPIAPAQSDDTAPLMSSLSLGCPQRDDGQLLELNIQERRGTPVV
jgi:hypothetical protein